MNESDRERHRETERVRGRATGGKIEQKPRDRDQRERGGSCLSDLQIQGGMHSVRSWRAREANESDREREGLSMAEEKLRSFYVVIL